MDTLLTQSNIVFALGILSVLFATYRYFREPQIKAEKIDALLQQHLRFFTENTETRFAAIQKNFDGLVLQSNNHIHTVDTKVDALREVVGKTNIEVAKLGTIIEERIPKRQS